jgi:hypothetical protein
MAFRDKIQGQAYGVKMVFSILAPVIQALLERIQE